MATAWRCILPKRGSAQNLLKAMSKQFITNTMDYLRAVHLLVVYVPSSHQNSEVLDVLIKDIASHASKEKRDTGSSGPGSARGGGKVEKDTKCCCIGTLVKTVEVFVETITDTDESCEFFLQPSLAALLRIVRSSEIIQAKLTAVSGVFKIIQKLVGRGKKNDYIRVGIRSVMYVSVELKKNEIVKVSRFLVLVASVAFSLPATALRTPQQ